MQAGVAAQFMHHQQVLELAEVVAVEMEALLERVLMEPQT